MATEKAAKSLQRLKRPEFEWLLHIAETHFGPLVSDGRSAVRPQHEKTRIRLMLGRYVGRQRFNLSAGKRDFDYLMFGLAGREEVWMVPKKEFGIHTEEAVFIDDATDEKNTWSRARLSIGERNIKLAPFLIFPTPALLKKQAAEKRKAEKLATALASRVTNKFNIWTIAAEKMRLDGLERLNTDKEFSALVQKVSFKLGTLMPINKWDWVLNNGNTVHFSLSKPFRGTEHQAFINISPGIAKKDWLAVGVRGSEVSWLIPMHIVVAFLRSKPTLGSTQCHTPFLGFRENQDCLWLTSDDAETFLPIEEFKLYDGENRTSPKILRANRERERIAMKANADRKEREIRLSKNEHDLAMYDALTNRFGDLELTATYPFRCVTKNNEEIVFGTYTPVLNYETRALVSVTRKWFETQWIAIGVKGQSIGWLIPTHVVKQMLEAFPSKERRQKPIWSTFIGPRKGRDRIWLGSDYRNGAVLDITEFRLTLNPASV